MRKQFKCPECEDAGVVEVELDTDRRPAMGPCQRCQQYCPICKKWRPRIGHLCDPIKLPQV